MRSRSPLLVIPVLALLASCSSVDVEPTTPGATGPAPEVSTATAPALADPDLSTWTPDAAPTGNAGIPRGLDLDASLVDENDPQAVAEAFALTLLTPDALIDVSPADVSRRAAQWASEDYAADLTADRAAAGGSEWIALGEAGGYLSVTLHPHPATEAGMTDVDPGQLSAEIPLLATITAHDADLPPRQIAALVSLHRATADSPWRVHAWHQEDYR